jgi:hypothetical protein
MQIKEDRKHHTLPLPHENYNKNVLDRFNMTDDMPLGFNVTEVDLM